jgi:hypothetical protein
MGYTIRRGKQPADQFAMIPNRYMRDVRLAWQTRGLLAWMLGHSTDFEITEEAMIEAGGVQEGFRGGGRDGVRKMIGQLEQVGYLRRERTSVLGGGSTVVYELLDPSDGLAVPPSDGLTVPRDDQGKQAESAGQPSDGLTVPRSLKEDHEKNKKTSSSTTKRATRVPDDFEPSDDMKAWFVAEGFDKLIHGRTEHDKFMDYWRAKPGVGGTKLDWVATWRNWMRSAAGRVSYRPVSAPPGTSVMPSSGMPQYSTTSTTNKRVMEGLALVEKFRLMEEQQ